MSKNQAEEEASGKQQLAVERTDMAEDRTLLANERTFAGWSRTALACIGVGLGFQAIFRSVEPTWVAKLIATMMILLGVYIIWMAERRATRLRNMKSGNGVKLMEPLNFLVMAIAITSAALILTAAIWLLI